MKWWLELAIAAAGVFALRWVGRWPAAILAGAAAGVSLLAAGSLRAVGYVLKRAAGARGFKDGTTDSGEGTGAAKPSSDRAERTTASRERMPARAAFALDTALYFAGVALALLAFFEHAAAAGWAGAAAGMTAARQLDRWPRLKPVVFALAAAPSACLALVWVWPEDLDGLKLTCSAAAVLVMAGGACASGATVLAMRWRLSERLSLPPAMALAAWGLTWFFARGLEKFGRTDQPAIVAWGIGVGGVIALLGWASGALDGPAAGVVFFLTSRVYSFLDWAGSIPFLVATALGWRPRLPWRRDAPEPASPAPAGRAAGAPKTKATTKRSRRGAAYELAVGLLPMGLAGGYFAFGHGTFLAAYSALCAAAAAAALSELLRRRPRARVAAAAAAAALLPLFVWGFGLILDTYRGYGIRGAGAAAAGALVSWLASEVLEARSADWRELPAPLRQAGAGAVAAALAVCVAVLVRLGGAAAG